MPVSRATVVAVAPLTCNWAPDHDDQITQNAHPTPMKFRCVVLAMIGKYYFIHLGQGCAIL